MLIAAILLGGDVEALDVLVEVALFAEALAAVGARMAPLAAVNVSHVLGQVARAREVLAAGLAEEGRTAGGLGGGGRRGIIADVDNVLDAVLLAGHGVGGGGEEEGGNGWEGEVGRMGGYREGGERRRRGRCESSQVTECECIGEEK